MATTILTDTVSVSCPEIPSQYLNVQGTYRKEHNEYIATNNEAITFIWVFTTDTDRIVYFKEAGNVRASVNILSRDLTCASLSVTAKVRLNILFSSSDTTLSLELDNRDKHHNWIWFIEGSYVEDEQGNLSHTTINELKIIKNANCDVCYKGIVVSQLVTGCEPFSWKSPFRGQLLFNAYQVYQTTCSIETLPCALPCLESSNCDDSDVQTCTPHLTCDEPSCDAHMIILTGSDCYSDVCSDVCSGVNNTSTIYPVHKIVNDAGFSVEIASLGLVSLVAVVLLQQGFRNVDEPVAFKFQPNVWVSMGLFGLAYFTA